ncbi:MAG: FAD-dependent monooxygenase [Arthrobacter sp.]|jgi:2,4-dichlorophenol 6-monooxygenase|nr:FAD-dependent monooxygenase [Arthrobacter sp.]
MTQPIDVLVVGSGPSGASAAVLLARHGLSVTLVTRAAWAADSPRAHITNQRTMEVLRAIGLEDGAQAVAEPRAAMANQVLCTSIAGEEFGRLWSWGNAPERQGEYLASSPSQGCDLPQDRLEPLLLGEAGRLGVTLRFGTKLLEFAQDADGVSAVVEDQSTGQRQSLRAAYLLGADGGQSKIAAALNLPFEGTAGMADAMNVRFTADLSRHVAHRPGSLFEVIQPQREEFLGHGMLRMVRPWNDWVASFVYLGDRQSKLTEQEAKAEIEALIGDPTIEVTVTGLFPWRVNHVVATRYHEGRVICLGDAVHRHPPMHGLGANTCVQDAFNLAWKLALVIRGQADASLLETYTAERAPVGRQIVDRAIASWHSGRGLLPALGLRHDAPVAERVATFETLAEDSEAGALRRAEFERMLRVREVTFGSHGVETNQRYASAAILEDGLPPEEFERDPGVFIQPSPRPGAHLPHAWLGLPGSTVSSLDLAKPERFTLFTRERGSAWEEAASGLAAESGLPLTVVRVARRGDALDLYGDFASRTGLPEDGALLVRPDQFVAWRSDGAAGPHGEPAAVLREVFARLLGRESVQPAAPVGEAALPRA